MSRPIIQVVSAALVSLSLVGGGVVAWKHLNGHTPIRQVLANADRLHNKEIEVRAEVREGADLFGYGAYELDDRTGRIWVFTSTGSPVVGRTVKVRGRVKRMLQFPSALQHALALPGAQVVGLEEVRRD